MMAPWARNLQVVHLDVFNAGTFISLRIALTGADGMKLHELAQTSTAFNATDPKDKVFALVGLASDAAPAFIDYKLTLRQVMVNLAMNGLRGGVNGTLANLDLLSSIRHLSDGSNSTVQEDDGKMSTLPLWVPNFFIYDLILTNSFFPLTSEYVSASPPLLDHPTPLVFGKDDVSPDAILMVSGSFLTVSRACVCEAPSSTKWSPSSPVRGT
jgi:hypothetical protein